MKKTFLILIVAVSNYTYSAAQIFDVDTIQYHGDASKFFNLVILSDGYTTNELAQFVTDAQAFSNDFFTTVPFLNYRSYFNVFAIKVPSNQSGASHPGIAFDVLEPVIPVKTVDNYFGSTFDQYGIHRLLVATATTNIINVLANNFPSYDQAIILVNSPEYGGSGGEFPTASLNEFSSDIAIHELGHSIAALKDEYYPGDIYAEEAINMTQDTNPATVRWKNWYHIDSIGIYRHTGGGNASDWYKPANYCKMQVVDSAFCAVCVEGIIERLHSLISPVVSYFPGELDVPDSAFPRTFGVDLMQPVPNTLKTQWTLNGAGIAMNVDSLQLTGSELHFGTNTLSVWVEDTTAQLKVDNHQNVHLHSVVWTINKNPVGILMSSAEHRIELSLYPNPASAEVTVAIKTTLRGKLKVELYDLAGKKLKTADAEGERFKLDLSDLPAGTFIVKLLAGKQAVLSKQLMKL